MSSPFPLHVLTHGLVISETLLQGESVVCAAMGDDGCGGRDGESMEIANSDSFACYLVAKVIVNLRLCCSDQSRPVRTGVLRLPTESS